MPYVNRHAVLEQLKSDEMNFVVWQMINLYIKRRFYAAQAVRVLARCARVQGIVLLRKHPADTGNSREFQ